VATADAADFASLLQAARRRLANGTCSEGLAAALALELGVDIAAARDRFATSKRIEIDHGPGWSNARPLPEALPLSVCRRLHCVAVMVEPNDTAFLVDDPWSADDLRQLAELYGRVPRLVWSTRARIRSLIEQMASSTAGAILTAQSRIQPYEVEGAAAAEGSNEESGRVISLETLQDIRNDVVRFVDRHILEAWQAGASDIHFETRRRGIDVKYRIDGVLVEPGARGDERAPGEASINRIKVLARLDISETRIPQDGRFRAIVGGRGIDFRVSIMPSIFGEDAVIRLLDKAQLRSGDDRIDLARLGFDPDSLRRLRTVANEPHGMVLVTGPTGSGKTTTLYAVLSELHRGDEKIITIEDPVEYELPGVLQIPVNEKKGLTFARGLRSILRHDPDKILVGEIRDPETAEIAVQAALTGHLVFTSVHANNVYDVVGRFLHMNVDLYGFVSALNGIIAQRLLRLNCRACSVSDDDAAASHSLQSAGFAPGTIDLRRGRGCAGCRGSGYAGRVAVGEVLPVDDRFRELVVSRASGRSLREHVATLNVVPLRMAALKLLATGRTTLEEISRVVGSSD
jgi:general secretion pathway protein E